MKHFLLAGWAAALALLAPVAAQASDLVLTNGRIYTAAASGWAEAIAITGDHIEAVGSIADVLKTRNAQTRVVDLHGQMVIPGITDNHTHIWFGSLALTHLNLSTEHENITPSLPKRALVLHLELPVLRLADALLQTVALEHHLQDVQHAQGLTTQLEHLVVLLDLDLGLLP